MRKLNLKQFLAGSAALTVVSAGTIDAGVLLADRTGALDVSPDWYLNAPLAVWFAAGSYISLALVGRILRDLDGRPGPIQQVSAGAAAGRPIPWHRNGKTSNVFASAVQSIFHQDEPEPEQRQQTIAWLVPVEDQTIKVREHELKEFLEAAARRTKHQLSERYWCRTRNMWTCRYRAYVRLLLEAGLVEGRYHGAAGRLATKPKHCLSVLKYDSPYVL